MREYEYTRACVCVMAGTDHCTAMTNHPTGHVSTTLWAQ